MLRISGLTDERIAEWEAVIEAAMRTGLQQVMNAIADRIAAIQVASVLVAADGDGPVPAQEPDVPEGDGLPPGQPYVSPDDLASIPPAWQSVVADNLVPIAAEIWYESAAAIYASMVDATGAMGIPSVNSLAAEQYLARARNTFDEVGDHLWGVARAELLDGFERGESIPELAQRLRDSAGIAERTGTLVARTQVIEASNAGSIATARVSGLDMLKEWIATPDPRTRPTHIAADGQRQPLSEPFTVGGYSADFPADPSLPPSERYNCRCTVGYVMPEREARQAPEQVAPPEPLPGQSTGPGVDVEIPSGPSGYPARPGYPAQPGIPATSGRPARPGRPSGPGYPGRPGYPARPGRPTPRRTLPSRPGGALAPDDLPDDFNPAAIRRSLAGATTSDELAAAWQAEWRAITGRDIAIRMPPDPSLATMRQYAEGLLRSAERFPEIDIGSIDWFLEPNGSYAKMTIDLAGSDAPVLRINAYWSARENRTRLLRSMRGDVQGWTDGLGRGWSVRGASSAQATMFHEFAHAMAMGTFRGRVNPAVLRAVERRAALEGIEPDTLVARDISGYAGSDLDELIAEAFTDVLVNGPRASAISREIYDLLVFEYRASGLGIRMLPRVDLEPDLEDFADFRDFPSAPGLASRTVPQLRALAAERGITIPAGARKADIVRLLEQPGPDVPSIPAAPMTPAQFEARLNAAVTGDEALQAAGVALRTAAERKAYADYVSQFRFVNTALRNNGGVIPAGREFALERRLSAGLDSALARSRLPADIRVHRVGGTVEFEGGIPRVGAEWTDHGYISTSTQRKIAGRGEVEMRILVPQGTRAVSTPELDVNEVLLDRGTRFRVVSVSEPDALGVRRLDVEILPDAPPIVVAPQAAVTSTRAAIARQVAIDKARVVGDLGVDVLAQLENGMGAAALRTRITQTARRLGTPDKVRDALLAVVDDPVALRQAVAAVLRTSKIDIVAGDAGQIVRFDRRTMQAIDAAIADDAHVIIVRPGLSFLRGRERIQLSKATVETATPEEVALAERRATRAAARERNRQLEQASGTARLLAEMDELLAKRAEVSVIRERLDDALLAPEALFANADPAVMKALRDALGSAGDVAKLRLAVTRLSTKAKIKAISRSGSKVKYDPDLMDPLPGAPEIKAGAQVTVVTRGSSVTLPDGTVVQLRKAVVTPVAKPVKAAMSPVEAEREKLRRLTRDVPKADVRPLGGGYSADTELLTFPDGRRAVRKTYGQRLAAEDEGDREILGAMIAEASDARVAAAIQLPRSRNRLLMEYIDGQTGDELLGPGGTYGRSSADILAAQGRYIDSDEGRRLGIADYLMGNTDRNDGNWLVTPSGRVVGIDHGMAFGRSKTSTLLDSPFNQWLRRQDGSTRLADSIPIAPEDLAIIRRRIEALRSLFDGPKRGKFWYESVLARLAQLEKRATPGAPRLIADR